MPQKSSRLPAYLALLGNAFIWGICLPWVKKGLGETTPMVFLFYRYLFACITCLPLIIIFWKKVKIKNLKQLVELSSLGFLNTIIAHWFLYQGLQRTSALESSILTTLTPVFVVFGAGIFLKENITKTERIGIIFTFIASLFIVLEPFFLNSKNHNLSNPSGNLLVLTYVILWMFCILWMKKISKKYHPFTITYTSFFISIVGFALLAYFENPHFIDPAFFKKPYAFSASLYMGTLGSVAALFLYQYGQSRIEASEATLFTYLQSIFAIPLAIFWLKEYPSLITIISGFLIAVGVIIAETRWKKQKIS